MIAGSFYRKRKFPERLFGFLSIPGNYNAPCEEIQVDSR
jgi:hypothetical protein